MQTRLGNRVADRFPKLRDDHLLGLVNRIEGIGENEDHDENKANNRGWKPRLFHHCGLTTGLVESGRIGSSCRRDSSMMIFCPI